MSVDATRATWKLGKLITAVQKLILLSLADRAGESGECWPSLKRLVVDTNLDRHTIVDNRQILINKGLLEYTGEFKGRTKSIPVMRLTYIECREGDIDIENEENYSSAKSNTALGSGVEMPTGSSVKTHTAKQCVNPHTEPKRLEPKIEPKRSIVDFKKSTSKKKNFSQYKQDERFMQFYELYPRKQKPADAYKAFLSTVGDNEELLERVINHVRDSIKLHTQWQDKQYIPLPASYLRSSAFDGEILNEAEEAHKKAIIAKLEASKRLAEQEKLSQKQREYEAQKYNQFNQDGQRYRDIVKEIAQRAIPEGLINLKKSMKLA